MVHLEEDMDEILQIMLQRFDNEDLCMVLLDFLELLEDVVFGTMDSNNAFICRFADGKAWVAVYDHKFTGEARLIGAPYTFRTSERLITAKIMIKNHRRLQLYFPYDIQVMFENGKCGVKLKLFFDGDEADEDVLCSLTLAEAKEYLEKIFQNKYWTEQTELLWSDIDFADLASSYF